MFSCLRITHQFGYKWHVLQIFHGFGGGCRIYGHALKYPLVGFENAVQILAQTQAETAHATVEEYA